MRRVLKYDIPIEGVRLPLPEGATPLHVACQGTPETVQMWVDADKRCRPAPSRFFYIVPTGGAVDDGDVYVGSALGGLLVWHVYEAVDR